MVSSDITVLLDRFLSFFMHCRRHCGGLFFTPCLLSSYETRPHTEKSGPPGLISRRHAHLGYVIVYVSSVFGLRVGYAFTVVYHHRVRPLAAARLHDRQAPFGASSRAVESPLVGGSNDVNIARIQVNISNRNRQRFRFRLLSTRRRHHVCHRRRSHSVC